MTRYSDQIRDEFNRPVDGATVYVYDNTGALETLTDDLAAPLANPVTSDEFGEFYFNTDDGAKQLEIHFGGQVRWKETIFVGAGVPAVVADGDKGDIAVSGGGTNWAVKAAAITLAKMANLATARFIGRVTGGAGVPEALTGTQATALLDTVTSALKGLAPASGGGALNYLRADGTWNAPPGGGGYVPPTGTGFVHITGGAQDGASKLVDTADINNAQVTLAKMANLAANSFIGNNTGGAAVPLALTVAQAKALLALVKGDVGLGNVDNTSDVNKPVSTAQQTALDLKKNLIPNIQAVASAATVTPTFLNDQVNITAQATGLTLANPTGAAQDGWAIAIRIKDNGTARGIAYGAQYRAIGVTLPATTVINKTLYLGMVFNAADTKWDVLAVAQEA